jgi:hypothetical protein
MILGISGKIGSGKDTVGKIIQYLTHTSVKEHNLTYDEFINLGFEEDAFDWKIKKFADKLKDIVCLLIGCTREQLEDREFKETPLGPEWVINRVKIGVKGDKFGIKGFHNTHTLEKIFLSIEEAQDFVKEFYDKSFSREQEQMTPRLMMQLLGTEAGRQIIHPNIWVNALMADYKGLPATIIDKECPRQGIYDVTEEDELIYGTIGNLYPNWIITDCRFPNELKAIKDKGGITIRVNRPYEIVDNTIKDGRFTAIPLTDAQMFSETHPSETSLDSAEFDYTIWNNEGIPELIEEVKLILQKEKIII